MKNFQFNLFMLAIIAGAMFFSACKRTDPDKLSVLSDNIQ